MDVFTVGAVSVPLPLAGFTTYNLGVFDTRAVDQ